MEKLIKHIQKTAEIDNINILIEFIFRSSAEKAYEILKDTDISGKEVQMLTGDVSSYERKNIIHKFCSRKNLILVATQVVEAGIDIDADIGYKDISLLDSEEQFLGRINRHYAGHNKYGIVYFFDMDNAGLIYRNDIRKDKILTLAQDDMKEVLIKKDFKTYYDKVIAFLKSRGHIFQDFCVDQVETLNFPEVEKTMNLIQGDIKYSVFLSRKIELEDGKVLDGDIVWEDYVNLLENTEMDYAEKRVRLSEVAVKLQYFVIQTRDPAFKWEKHIGDLYYLSDTEEYFEDGKFIRKNFDNDLFIN